MENWTISRAQRLLFMFPAVNYLAAQNFSISIMTCEIKRMPTTTSFDTEHDAPCVVTNNNRKFILIQIPYPLLSLIEKPCTLHWQTLLLTTIWLSTLT